jgi:glycosyltransferase involved in cell wall biosynthesis
MLISVLLPVKNAENTLKVAVSSILAQVGVEFELIVIDDHSSDNSIGIIKSISDHRIKLIKNKANGIAAALNTGLEIAHGSYIARMDADDFSAPMRLKTQLDFAIQNPQIDVFSCLVEYVSTNSPNLGYKHYVDWINSIINPEDHFANRFSDATIAHPTLFCKKSVFDSYGIYATDPVPEDYELWLRWMEQGVSFVKINEFLYSWTDNESRASRVHENYSIDKFYQVKSYYFSNWLLSIGIKEIYICGYGSEVFKKVQWLEEAGITIKGYVDVKSKPGSSRMVITYSDIIKDSKRIYLSYIGDRQGKLKIKSFFQSKAMVAGRDYFFMS